MANLQHVEWIQEGVAAWNERRESHSFKPDFSEAGFPSIFEHLAGDRNQAQGSVDAIRNALDALRDTTDDALDTIETHLDLANDLGARDHEARRILGGLLGVPDVPAELRSKAEDFFNSRDMAETMSWIPLANVNFRWGSFVGAFLSGCILRDSDLRNTDFRGARLRYANLRGANLQGSDLRGAQLWDADLTGANLAGADLRGTQFWRTILKGTLLHDTHLGGASFLEARPWESSIFPPTPEYPLQLPVEKLPVQSITSIDDILHLARALQKFHGDEVTLYYRGEAKSDWWLEPSVMRQGYAQFESQMLIDLMARRPEEFAGRYSALDQWVLAQHHGLRTRFLDISKNPLVGIFNAAAEGQYIKSDGRVHIFVVPHELIEPFNSTLVSIMANFAKLPKDDQTTLLGKSLDSSTTGGSTHAIRTIARNVLYSRLLIDDKYEAATHLFEELMRSERPVWDRQLDIRELLRVIVVEPQQSNERIRAQSGAFLLSAFHERFEPEVINAWNSDIPLYSHYVLPVRAKHKIRVLNDLKLLSVSRETLYPGLDESAQAVMQKYVGPNPGNNSSEEDAGDA